MKLLISLFVTIPAIAFRPSLTLVQNICCPVGMTCQSTDFTTSKILCCNSTSLDLPCQFDHLHPPQCPHSTFECAYLVGGGCCPIDTQCSPNGCIKFEQYGNPILTTYTFTATVTSSIALDGLKESAGTTTNHIAVSPTITDTVTISRLATPTTTAVKDGEVAQRGAGAHVARFGLCLKAFTCPSVDMFLLVAMWMALL